MSIELSSLSFSYLIDGEEASVLSFGYIVTPDTEESSSLSLSYQIAPSSIDSWPKTMTPVSHCTQQIGNLFPYWHAAKRKVGGKTQRVLNSLAGYHLGELGVFTRDFEKSLYLSTVSTTSPETGWIFARPVTRAAQRRNINLLKNPTFSEVLHWRNGPEGWAITTNEYSTAWSLIEGKGLYNLYALRLLDQITISQTVQKIFRKKNKFTATLWYAGMSPTRASEPSRNHGPKLIVSIKYFDGTSESFSKALEDDTGGAWKKAYITVDPSKDTFSIEFIISCDTFYGDSVCLDIGGAMIHDGSVQELFTDFSTSPAKTKLVYPKEEYSETLARGEITYNRIKTLLVEDSYSFEELKSFIPLRATVTLDSEATGANLNVIGNYVEPDDFIFDTGWQVNNNTIEKFNASIGLEEIFDTFSIAELENRDQEYLYYKPSQIGVTHTLEALTVLNDLLYVVVKEEFKDKTLRLIKVVNPLHRWEHDNYLECVGEIYINNGDGDCTFIGYTSKFNQLLIVIDEEQFVVDLVLDKAAALQDENILFLNDIGEAKLTY